MENDTKSVHLSKKYEIFNLNKHENQFKQSSRINLKNGGTETICRDSEEVQGVSQRSGKNQMCLWEGTRAFSRVGQTHEN